MAPSNSSTTSIKDLSAALIAFFAPSISSLSTNVPNPHSAVAPLSPIDLFAQADCFLDHLKLHQPSSSQSRPSSLAPPSSSASNLSSPDLAINRAHLASLLDSLRKLWLARPNNPCPSDHLPSTLLSLLEKITLDDRARPLLARLDYSLTHTWWSSLLLPCLTSHAHPLSPAGEQSLVNLLAAALAADPHAPLPPPAPPLALELFAIYKRQHACPGRTTARQSLLSWGKSAPKELFALIDALLASPAPEPDQADDQTYALTLLIDFATSSPYSIHNLLSTCLIGSLIRTILDPHPPAAAPLRLATDALLLILPRVPTAIDGCLALLLVALTRLLCWPRTPDAPADAERTLEPAQTAIFGFLYGLAPCTLVEFVRTPAEALAALAGRTPPAGAPTLDPTAVDASMLRPLPLAAQHRLAQDLFLNTPASERTAIAEGGLNFFESAELIERCERNVIVESSQAAEPIPLPVPLVWSTTSNQPSAGASTSGDEGLMEELKHENMMLKNKLNVERYLKQQHLQQMGSLHKQNILGAGLEAENRNLHAINKELQRKLTEALDRLHQHEHEQEPAHSTTTTTNSSPTTTCQVVQNSKFFKRVSNQQSINYREQIIKLGEAKKELVHRLKYQEKMFMAQKVELSSRETEAHALRNELKLLQPRLDLISSLETKNDLLSKAMLTWDDDLRRFRESRKQIDKIRAEWKRFESLANSSEIENQKLRSELRLQAELNQQLKTENQIFRDRSNNHSSLCLKVPDENHQVDTVCREGLVECLLKKVDQLREENVRLKVSYGGSSGGSGRCEGGEDGLVDVSGSGADAGGEGQGQGKISNGNNESGDL